MRIMDEATMERVAQYNIEYQKEHGVSPSYRNIMHALHLGSLATVQRYLNALEKSGRIERTRIGTIDPLPQLHTGKTTATPLLGRIACGEPTTEVEHIEESFALPQDLFGTGKLFMLHAHGDSMIEAGIDDGDLLVIREQNYADDGEIIVALVNGDNTLKRLIHKGGKTYLHPENSNMKDIPVKNLDIQGVLVSCIKMY